MQMNEQVLTALEVLRNFAENDFERHRIDVLEKDLTSPPVAEIIDDNHQSFNGLKYGRGSSTKHLTHNNFIHRVIFQYYYGDIPNGYDIHHKDLNPTNNDISNLQMLTKSEHAAIHIGVNIPKEYICEFCGKKFIATSKLPAKFCSRKCLAAHRRKTKGIPHYHKNCLVCGKSFVTTNNRQKYCSKECCYLSLTKPKKPTKKICKYCGQTFNTLKQTQKYCSLECCHKSKKTIQPRVCPICGKTFTPQNNINIYCSRSCGRRSRNTKK